MGAQARKPEMLTIARSEAPSRKAVRSPGEPFAFLIGLRGLVPTVCAWTTAPTAVKTTVVWAPSVPPSPTRPRADIRFAKNYLYPIGPRLGIAYTMSPWSVDWVDLDGNRRTDPIDINCKCFDPNKTIVLNRNAWELVPNGQWAAQTQVIPFFQPGRRPNESANLARNFRFGADGRFNLHVRVEFQNVFNRRYLPAPALGNFQANPTVGANGNYTAGFGTFGNLGNSGAFGTPRSGQFVGRFTF